MSVATVTYFKGRGLAQFVRVLLSYLSIEYNNETIESISDELRATLPFGQVPLFKDTDGTVLSQTSTITRYIAEKNGFSGKSLIEKYRVDEIVTAIHSDLISPMGNPEAKEKLVTITLPRILGKFNKQLESNAGHLVGDSYTLADLYLYVIFEYLQFRGISNVTAELYPNIQKLQQHFEENAGVKLYLKNRPETQF